MNEIRDIDVIKTWTLQSTLMAAEQLGRICYMVELDPCYIDVIIKRWEEYTGEKAQYLGNCAKESENSTENDK